MGLLDENLPNMGERNYADYMDYMKRLQIAGGLSIMNDNGVKAAGYGGRIGYDIPQGSNNLNIGLSGQGFSAKGDGFNVKNKQISGADVTYQMPDSSVSMRYDKYGMMDQPQVNHPMAEYEMQRGIAPAYKDLLQLIYRKQF